MVFTRSLGSFRALRGVHDRLYSHRTLRRARTRAGTLPPSKEDPCPRGNQQFLRRHLQLRGHVQLPDMVPNRAPHERKRSG